MTEQEYLLSEQKATTVRRFFFTLGMIGVLAFVAGIFIATDLATKSLQSDDVESDF